MHIQVTLLAENAEKFALLCWKLCCITLNGININIIIFIVCRLHSFNFRYTGSCGVHHLWRQDIPLTTAPTATKHWSNSNTQPHNHPPDHGHAPLIMLLCKAELCTCTWEEEASHTPEQNNRMLGREQPTNPRVKTLPATASWSATNRFYLGLNCEETSAYLTNTPSPTHLEHETRCSIPLVNLTLHELLVCKRLSLWNGTVLGYPGALQLLQ